MKIGRDILSVPIDPTNSFIVDAYETAVESLADQPERVTLATQLLEARYGLGEHMAQRVVGEAAMTLFAIQLESLSTIGDMPEPRSHIS